MHSPMDALRRSPVFAGVTEEALALIGASVDSVPLLGGQVLFQQGDAGEAAYLVLSGRLRVERAGPDGAVLLRELVRGDLVGEFALLTGAPRTATVTAMRDCEIGRLPRDRFDALLVAHPDVAIGISRQLAALLAAAPPPAGVGRRHPTVVVLQAAVADEDLQAAAHALTEALGCTGTVALVDHQHALDVLGPEIFSDRGASEEALPVARWLQQLEATHTHVICVASPAHPRWSAACLRQADLLLEALPAARVPEEPPRATTAFGRCRQELLVLHPMARPRVHGTGRWFAQRPYARCHHVRLGHAGDWARLARHLTGRSIGLALGGGGARGLAHLGLLRAMDELGIPVDEVGGTSIGGVIAAQYASGMGFEEMMARHREDWARFHPHRAYTLPLLGMVRVSAADAMMRHQFGGLEFEDCWIQGFTCSANLSTGDRTFHRRGSVADACLATMAIPALAPPYVAADGSLHVDGAVVDNLPVAGLTASVTIAASVSALVWRSSGYPRTPSPWRVLRDRWLSRQALAPYFPSLVQTVLSSILLAGNHRESDARQLSDLHLDIPVGEIALLAFERLEAATDVGYRYAHERLGQWWAKRDPSFPR